ncbi:hypothetical protein BDB00DRAFT_548085 [Zychaea mexicana]|uniref:uncharacterized protein n=1 Tax=Zychaea mexicana TaxID=64656 RepID=UPI0022FF3375|nr:uncharacterized protein BDB00DRAFT_548085 [Zychaea mexicana]KAI9497964.1 hypothetical protein BDB00DRAFT_548085 [Zychaea mexicana]
MYVLYPKIIKKFIIKVLCSIQDFLARTNKNGSLSIKKEQERIACRSTGKHEGTTIHPRKIPMVTHIHAHTCTVHHSRTISWSILVTGKPSSFLTCSGSHPDWKKKNRCRDPFLHNEKFVCLRKREKSKADQKHNRFRCQWQKKVCALFSG